MNEEIGVIKRELGDGKWDKILKRKMVELSVADNYEEAKEEWIATGTVFWSSFHVRRENIPDWISNSQMGYGKCLCGHGVVYHFQIQNTVNGVIECVGSDHINSYLIMRQISNELKIPIDMITDEQVQEWINVRIKGMKAEAWWETQGVAFTTMFEAVKEMDLYYNVHEKGGYYWDAEIEENRPITTIRKRAEGKFGSPNYQMASIVWRWNHPDNPKNQQTVHGYPNDNLMKDLALFYVKSTEFALDFIAEKERREDKKKRISERKAKEERDRMEALERRKREERERLAYMQTPEYLELERKRKENQLRLIREQEEKRAEALRLEQLEHKEFLNAQSRAFRFGCAQFNMPMFDETWAENINSLRRLVHIKKEMEQRKNLSQRDVDFLYETYRNVRPTEKQLKYLKDLGYTEKVKTKFEASELIKELTGE